MISSEFHSTFCTKNQEDYIQIQRNNFGKYNKRVKSPKKTGK